MTNLFKNHKITLFGYETNFLIDIPPAITADYFPDIDTERLISAAIRFICAFEKNYSISGKNGKAALELIKESEQSNDTQMGIEALNNFAGCLFNDPLLYSSNISKNNFGYEITCENISCYFVELKGVLLPIGSFALLGDDFGKSENHIQHINYITKNFIEYKQKQFDSKFDQMYKKINEKAKEYKDIPVYNKNGENKSVAKCNFHIAVFIFAFVAAAVFAYKYFIVPVDFRLFPDVFSSGGSIVQIAAYITANYHTLNLNSSLPFAFVALALLSLLWCVIMFFPLVTKTKKLAVCNRSLDFSKKCDAFAKELFAFGDQISKTVEAIKTSDDTLTFSFDKNGNNFGSGIARLKKIHSKKLDFKGELKLRHTAALIVILAIILGAGFMGNFYRSEKNIDKYNSMQKSVSVFLNSFELRADILYGVTKSSEIYSGPGEKAFCVYIINPGRPFSFVEQGENTQNEQNIRQIRFLSEYGYITGWVKDISYEEFNPVSGDNYTRQFPSKATASSVGKGSVDNLSDRSSNTAWSAGTQGNGVGEKIEFCYESAVDVDMLMFMTGSASNGIIYQSRNRPVCYRLEFYNGDKLSAALPVKLEDTRKMQFVGFNKKIKADRICFVIQEVINGKLIDNTYITELGVYTSNDVQ